MGATAPYKGDRAMNKGITILSKNSFKIDPEFLTKCPKCGQTATKKTTHTYCPHCEEMYQHNDRVKKEYPAIIDQLEEYVWNKYKVRILSPESDWFQVSYTGCLYDAMNGLIFHESNLSHKYRIVGIAHEIGHVMDFHEKL